MTFMGLVHDEIVPQIEMVDRRLAQHSREASHSANRLRGTWKWLFGMLSGVVYNLTCRVFVEGGSLGFRHAVHRSKDIPVRCLRVGQA